MRAALACNHFPSSPWRRNEELGNEVKLDPNLGPNLGLLRGCDRPAPSGATTSTRPFGCALGPAPRSGSSLSLSLFRALRSLGFALHSCRSSSPLCSVSRLRNPVSLRRPAFGAIPRPLSCSDPGSAKLFYQNLSPVVHSAHFLFLLWIAFRGLRLSELQLLFFVGIGVAVFAEHVKELIQSRTVVVLSF